MSKHRWGCVEVTKAFLAENPNFVEEYIPEFKVQSIVPKDERTVIYYGIHPEFEEMEIGIDEIPCYMFYFRQDEDGSVHFYALERDILQGEDAIK